MQIQRLFTARSPFVKHPSPSPRTQIWTPSLDGLDSDNARAAITHSVHFVEELGKYIRSCIFNKLAINSEKGMVLSINALSLNMNI